MNFIDVQSEERMASSHFQLMVLSTVQIFANLSFLESVG